MRLLSHYFIAHILHTVSGLLSVSDMYSRVFRSYLTNQGNQKNQKEKKFLFCFNFFRKPLLNEYDLTVSSRTKHQFKL